MSSFKTCVVTPSFVAILVATFLVTALFGMVVFLAFITMVNVRSTDAINFSHEAESSTSSWLATSTPSTPPYLQVLLACYSFLDENSHTIAILSAVAFLVIIVARTFLFLARWVLKALGFSFRPVLCVTALGLCARMSFAWSAFTVFKYSAFVVSVFPFLGLIWSALDVLWLCLYGWATSSTSRNVASTTTTRTASSTATASIPPTLPTPPMSTQAPHTFWGEFTLAARGVIILAFPLLAVLAFLVSGVVGAHGLVATVHHGWTLLQNGFTALGAKTLSGIHRMFAIVRAGMLMMGGGSKTIIIVRPYGRRFTLEMVKNKKQRTIKSLQKARKRQRAARHRTLLAVRPTTTKIIIHTEAEEISQAIPTTTATTARTREIKTDVLAAAPKITRCSSTPDLRSLSNISTLGLSTTVSLSALASSSNSSSSSSNSMTTTTETTTATAPTAEAERERSDTSNRVARGSVLDPAYDMEEEEEESKRGEIVSSSLPVCHALVGPAVAHRPPKSKVNKLARMGKAIKKMFTRTQTIIAQDGVLNLENISCKEPRCKGISFKKMFERKLSSSSSTSASSSPSSMDSRRSSMSFSAGSFAAVGECSY